MADPQIPEYLSDMDLARRYSISRVTVWRWVADNDFPRPVKLGANCTRWRRQDIEAWEASRVAVEAA